MLNTRIKNCDKYEDKSICTIKESGRNPQWSLRNSTTAPRSVTYKDLQPSFRTSTIQSTNYDSSKTKPKTARKNAYQNLHLCCAENWSALCHVSNLVHRSGLWMSRQKRYQAWTRGRAWHSRWCGRGWRCSIYAGQRQRGLRRRRIRAPCKRLWTSTLIKFWTQRYGKTSRTLPLAFACHPPLKRPAILFWFSTVSIFSGSADHIIVRSERIVPFVVRKTCRTQIRA